MKKRLPIIIAVILLCVSFTCIGANCQEINAQSGFMIEFNGELTGYTSIIYNDIHYVPMRTVFEKFGASVFYNSQDCEILALSRDGDIIRHIVGSSVITVNGEQKIFKTPSFLENGTTYISIDMVSAAFCPDEISYDEQQLNIQKTIFSNDYHKLIKDVLDVSNSGGFYPERFQRYLNYHIKMPGYSMQDVLFRVNIGLDYSFYENVTIIDEPYDTMVLVNKYHQLPLGFEQLNLVNMNRAYTANDGKQYWLAGEAYEKYIEMWDAAKKDGLSMRVVSAYRTEDYQRGLYNNKVRTTGKVYADNYSARPGHSEHQTGLAVDIGSTRNGVFEYSAEFRWMLQHAHEYGYILRYPKGKEWITGYSYEPWHYRYVGTDAARIIYEEGITYEEYYAKYIAVNKFR